MDSTLMDESEIEMEYKLEELVSFEERKVWDFDQEMCELLGVDYLSDSIDLMLWYFTLVNFSQSFAAFDFPFLHNSNVQQTKN